MGQITQKIGVCLATILFSLQMGCGVKATTTTTSGDSEADSDESTVLMTGTIADSSEAVSLPTLKAQSSACSGVTKAIATATDATTVTDEELSECTWELSLTVGKSYVIGFVGKNDQFIAVLVANTGSIFPIIDGVSKINLGKISINSNRAKTAVDMLCYLDTDDDDAFDCEDDTPCGGDACDQYYSCEFFGLKDKNKDKVCDEWEDSDGTSLGDTGSDETTDDNEDSEDDVELGTFYLLNQTSFGVPLDLKAALGLTDNLLQTTLALEVDESGGSSVIYGVVAGLADAYRLYLFRSTDGGLSFTKTTIESCTTFLCIDHPAMDVGKDGVVHVAWTGGISSGASSISGQRVYYSKSEDGGTSFSDPIQLNTNSSWDYGPDVAAGPDGAVYVVWEDHNDFVSLARSTDDGDSFSDPVTVAEFTFALLLNLSRKVEKANNQLRQNDNFDIVYAVWGDVRNHFPQTGDYKDLYSARSDDDGVSFEENSRVSQIGNYNVAPGLDMDNDGNLAICWYQAVDLGGVAQSIEIVFSRSMNAADNWTTEVLVSDSVNNYTPSIAVAHGSTGKAYVLWGFPGSPDGLYFVVEEWKEGV